MSDYTCPSKPGKQDCATPEACNKDGCAAWIARQAELRANPPPPPMTHTCEAGADFTGIIMAWEGKWYIEEPDDYYGMKLAISFCPFCGVKL